MVSIEHVALWVEDLDKVCEFYSRHFGASIGPLYQNPNKGFASRFLAFGSGARIELMKTTAMEPVRIEAGAQRMGMTHIAISLGSQAEVDRLTRELRGAGYPVLDEPRTTGDGYYESVVLDPEGNRLELTV
jgi:lactoylglutathione lyase